MKKRLSVILTFLTVSILAGCTSGRGGRDHGNDDTHKHVFEVVQREEPTCEEPGVEKHKICLTCEKVFDMNENEVTLASLRIEPLGHQESNYYVASGGKHYHICLREGCGKHLHEEAHTPVYHMAHSATCLAAGNIEYYSCSVCEKLFSDEECMHEITSGDINLPTSGHNLVHYDAVNPTCTEEFNNEC